MKRFWQMLALLLLALMVPASVCCLVQPQPSDECGCCSSGAKDHDAPAQPEICPSNTIARSQLPAQIIMPAMQMVELTRIIQELMRLNELAAAKTAPTPSMTTAPPQLPTTWVFARRAALPARAPSALT